MTMFRVNPRNHDQSLAAINRFLALVCESAKESIAEAVVAAPTLLQRLESMPCLMQQHLEVMRREVIHLLRRYQDAEFNQHKGVIESHGEVIWNCIVAADSTCVEREAKIAAEMESLRKVARACQALPEAFYCPLSYSVMQQPAMFRQGCGHSYEKSELLTWVAQCRQQNQPIVDPMTQQTVDGEWVINLALRDAIAAWPRLESAESARDTEIVNAQHVAK